MVQQRHKHRDVNWLYFNERVLLEAANSDIPLLERLRFLGIFSSNLDEYFRVRISQLRQLKRVRKSLRKKLALRPTRTLKQILETVEAQQERYGSILRDILSELESYGIYFKDASNLSEAQKTFLARYFDDSLGRDCVPLEKVDEVHLEDGSLYFVVHFEDNGFAFVNIPSESHDRFLEIPGKGRNFIFLDEVVRMHLDALFPQRNIMASYAIKLSRDAELYLEADYGDTALVDRIQNSLDQRFSGQPTRLLYDKAMPTNLRDDLRNALGIGKVDLFPGGRYHNLSDFLDFSEKIEDPRLHYEPRPPLPHPVLSATSDMFATIAEKDRLIHFPYQQFEVVEQFLRMAARDGGVTHIKMTLYRIARTSKLTDALLEALDRGTKVTLFVEAKARFDERNNIDWGKTFEDKGARVIFSVPNIKVHSKIALVERTEQGRTTRYAYIGTGNFNAKTARIYCDHGLFTAHSQITEDLHQVFATLERELIVPKPKRLLISPYNTRTEFMQHIETEIRNHRQGLPAGIHIKMNSLEDFGMINALYRASEAGVPIHLLVRGFSSLSPRDADELPEHGRPIRVTSIVDRYLEHARVYLFKNAGEEIMYMGSADWMRRNLDRRIEVVTPILDTEVFAELRHILMLQMHDTVKARVQDAEDSNRPVEVPAGGPDIRSQYAIYDYLRKKLDPGTK